MKIILFDGVCNLCNNSVQFIIKRDRKGVFKFSPIQSDAGQALFVEYSIDSAEVDSIVYIKDDRYFIQSSAILNILRDIGGIWKLCYLFILVPPFIRDYFYRFIAKSRYSVFGKRDRCMIPSKENENRFLD
jgi:predicted DCC family thiol-disulfide oxidoreductase YuxK